jgi:hypothetical protein
MLKQYFGNYLGICINNQDPESRGRVQVFIPHIMPALYENWNQDGNDISLECVGNNLPTGLNSDIIKKLTEILPWAEGALPIIGNSASGSYNSITGNFNQTSAPESLAIAGSVPAGSTAGQLIINSEKQVDSNGNIKVYYMPGNDGGGRYEIAGINERYHPQKAAQLKSLIDQGQYQQAETEAAAYIIQYTNTVAKISNGNPGIDYALRDACFNRGQGGANWMAKHAAGLPPSKGMDSSATKSILEVQQRDPVGFLNKFRAAGEAYERDVVGYRANFWKGLKRRWDDRLRNSLALAVQGGPNPINNPATAPDAAALPPSPHPFNNSDATTQSWNDPGLASVTQVNLEQPTQLSLTNNSASPAVASAASAATALPSTPTGGTPSGGSGVFSWRAAVARSGLRVDGRGIARLPSGTTGCMRVSWNIAGYITGRNNMAGSSGVAEAKLWQTLNSRLASQAPGFWGYLGKFGAGGFQPQQGDLVSHPYQPHGHAQIYIDGRWHAHKEADGDFSNYASKSGGSHVWRLTPAGQEAVRRTNVCNTQFLGQPYAGPLGPVGGTFDGENGLENGTNLVQNPTGTMSSPMDTSGMPQGMFAHPSPGALLWVFFREGNPLFPVYFAASYGAAEWQAMQKASSPPLYDAQNGGSEINSESHFRPNNAGTLMFRGSVTAGKDNRAVRLAHSSGGYFELLPTGTMHFSPNEHVSHIAGNGYNYCLNREEWTQGDENRVTIGNQRIVVGNPSQTNIEAIEKLTEKVKSINQKMTEQPSSSTTA